MVHLMGFVCEGGVGAVAGWLWLVVELQLWLNLI